MSEEDAKEFAELPGAADAVAARRWDEQAKVAGAGTPGFGHYRPLLASLMA